MNIEYLRQRSFLSDLSIIVRTALSLCRAGTQGANRNRPGLVAVDRDTNHGPSRS